MDAGFFSFPFGHDGQSMRATALAVSPGWKLTVEDEKGRIRCTWQPDDALFAGDPDRTVPTVLGMLVDMVRSGVIPLTAGDAPLN